VEDNYATNESLEEAVIYAKKYLEDMLSFFGLNTEVHATTEEDIIELSVPSTHMNGFLIGQRGETMRALQFMTSMSLKSKGFSHNRVNVDVANYKANRHERLAEKALEWIEKVKESSEPMHLRPMNAADRRIVHKVASEHGLTTASEGEGRDRHVVLTVDSGVTKDDTNEQSED
jgi:spoIIIJ-associated protein